MRNKTITLPRMDGVLILNLIECLDIFVSDDDHFEMGEHARDHMGLNNIDRSIEDLKKKVTEALNE